MSGIDEKFKAAVTEYGDDRLSYHEMNIAHYFYQAGLKKNNTSWVDAGIEPDSGAHLAAWRHDGKTSIGMATFENGRWWDGDASIYVICYLAGVPPLAAVA